MNIDEQFNLVAKEYDANRKKFIPCFDDYYGETTKFIAANIGTPKRVLDLGAGTGLLSYFWFGHFPKSEYVLVDIAGEMLEVAQKRFDELENVSYQILDYSKELPKEDFDVIVSALSIHHLEHEDKKELFTRIYDKLPEGGVFINYDQFCAGKINIVIVSKQHEKGVALYEQIIIGNRRPGYRKINFFGNSFKEVRYCCPYERQGQGSIG